MRCPVDDATLVMSSREGVEIDYCPQCRGVWLDRGELDKIIDRSASGTQTDRLPRMSEERKDSDGWRTGTRDSDSRGYDGRSDNRYGARPKRKESFLSDLFDFG